MLMIAQVLRVQVLRCNVDRVMLPVLLLLIVLVLILLMVTVLLLLMLQVLMLLMLQELMLLMVSVLILLMLQVLMLLIVHVWMMFVDVAGVEPPEPAGDLHEESSAPSYILSVGTGNTISA